MPIVLRPSTESDFEFVLSCEADADTSQFILAWSVEQHDRAIQSSDCSHLIVVDPTNQNRLGFVMLFGLDSPHQSIELRRIVSAVKGQGIGRAAVQETKRHVFDILKAHRLWLDVKSKNSRARHLYRSEGFVEEGLMRECLFEEGERESLVLMSLLRNEYAG